MFKKLLLSTCLVGSLAIPALAATVGEGETLAEDQSIRYWMLDSVKTLDPQKSSDVGGSHVLRQVFEGLMSMDAKGAMIPAAASGYEVSEDKKTYTFTLRDANWSDGTPVTAGDFVYAWRRAADPATASQYAWFIELMNVVNAKEIIAGDMDPSALGVTAIDDKTLEVQLTNPTPYFIKTVAQPTTFPVKQSVVEEFGDAWVQPENIVSNGPYLLKGNTTGVSLLITKNPDYWDADSVIIDEIDFVTINDQNIALTRYLAGELDWMDTLPAGQYPNLKEERPDEAISIPRGCSYGYFFNVSDSGPEALQDSRVRRALSLAIDRDVVVEKILRGGQKPAYTWTHWAIEGFDAPEVAIANMTQDERNEMAKQLLAEAGYGPDNPLSITLQYNTSEAHKKIAIAVQQFWKRVGVKAELANFEWKVFLDRLASTEFDATRYGWCADFNEASSFLNIFTTEGQNYGKWSNAEFDSLMEQAKTSDNPGELYKQAEVILDAEAPYAPIYHYSIDMLVNSDLRGVPLENVQFRWYAKDLYRVAD